MKKIAAIIGVISLVLLIVIMVFHARNIHSEANLPVAEKLENGQYALVTGYLIGERPQGMDAVLGEINRKLREELGCELQINYLSWGDYQEKYPLLLATDEEADFVFSGNWCMYAQEAQKNAFCEISEDAIRENMPVYYNKIKNTDILLQSLVNGKCYMMPSASPDEKVGCVIYRKDLCRKYGIEEPKRFSDLSTYFQKIKENEIDMNPMNLSADYDMDTPFIYLCYENGKGCEDIYKIGVFWSFEDGADGKLEFVPIYEDYMKDNLLYAATQMKEWNDSGYINKDVFSNSVRSMESFVEGKSGIAFGNTIDIQTTINEADAKGYDCGMIQLLDQYGKANKDAYIANGVSILSSCKQPVLVMKILDLLMENPTYANLLYYGIEDVNYVVDAAGKAASNDSNNSYPVDSGCFWFIDRNIVLPNASVTDEDEILKEQIKNCLVQNPYNGFWIDTSEIENEVTSVKAVMNQYAYPLYIGMVDDVDSGIDMLERELKAAGSEKICQNLQKQALAYKRTIDEQEER